MSIKAKFDVQAAVADVEAAAKQTLRSFDDLNEGELAAIAQNYALTRCFARVARQASVTFGADVSPKHIERLIRKRDRDDEPTRGRPELLNDAEKETILTALNKLRTAGKQITCRLLPE